MKQNQNKLKQVSIFENLNDDWRSHWVDMPEYEQDKTEKEFAKITVRFRNIDDLMEFSKLISQNITEKTKSIYFPKIERGLNANKIYIDDNQISDIHNI
jgi:hypothetical protein